MPEEDGAPAGRLPRVRGIAHFDAVSLLCKLNEPVDNVKGQNEKTGASAAGSSDHKASSGNALVAAVSNFSNELGGSACEWGHPQLRYLNSNDECTSKTRTALSSSPTPFLASSCTGVLLESAIHHQLLEQSDKEREDACAIGVTRQPVSSAAGAEQCRLENVDLGAYYYRQYFYDNEHQNFFGIDDTLGPVAVSIKRDFVPAADTSLFSPTVLAGGKGAFGYSDSVSGMSVSSSSGLGEDLHSLYRVIVRTARLEPLRIAVLEECMVDPRARPTGSQSSISSHGIITTTMALPPRDVISYAVPSLSLGCLRIANANQKAYESLLRLDEQNISRQVKAGIMYCRAGQVSEEEMYNNVDASDLFKSFLNCIGDMVELKGFSNYRAQLDNKNDTTGTQSVYTTLCGNEIMFHVSTLLPHMEGKKQQLLRKRHIGNDITTIVFQEDGAQPFSPTVIRSQFQHIFIVVRHVPHLQTPASGPLFQVAVTQASTIPLTPPAVPQMPVFRLGAEFRAFLLAKLVNLENAAHRAAKFLTMAMRTRHEWLMDLVENHTTTQQLEPQSSAHPWGRFAHAFKGKGKKGAAMSSYRNTVISENRLVGGVAWPVHVRFWGKETNDDSSEHILCLSARYLCVVNDKLQQLCLFVPTSSVLGWTVVADKSSMCIYHGLGECLHFSLVSEDDSAMLDVSELVSRLGQFSDGSLCQEVVLERSTNNHLGFILLTGGIVGEVDPYGVAWKCGIRQNARVLEINGKPLCGKLIKDVVRQLREKSVTLLLVPPMAGAMRPALPTLQKLLSAGSAISSTPQSSVVSMPSTVAPPSNLLRTEEAGPVPKSPLGSPQTEGHSLILSPLPPISPAASPEPQHHQQFRPRSYTARGYARTPSSVSTPETFSPEATRNAARTPLSSRPNSMIVPMPCAVGDVHSPMFKGIVAKAKASLAASVAARSLPTRADQHRFAHRPADASLDQPVSTESLPHFRPRAASAASSVSMYSPTPSSSRTAHTSAAQSVSLEPTPSPRLVDIEPYSNGQLPHHGDLPAALSEETDSLETDYGDDSSLDVPDNASPEDLRHALVRAQSQLLRSHQKIAALRKENSNLVKVVEKLRTEQSHPAAAAGHR